MILPILALLLTPALPRGRTVEPRAFEPPTCDILPLPHDQVSLRIDGHEKTRWHFGPDAPRPFFYPFNGPAGVSLTRMGHPGAQNHDHHRSIWFAHHNVNGHDFWSDSGGTRIRQKHWYRYRNGEEEAVMAVLLEWLDPEGTPVLEQDLIAALRPGPRGEHSLEIQIELRPARSQTEVMLGQTNFGLLAIRVSQTLSVHFGDGRITGSDGAQGETALFGRPSEWMDYSGPVVSGEGSLRRTVTEGLTCFDHPANPGYPAKWHVREDGWMGPSLCRDQAMRLTKEKPLILRYLLQAHRGGYQAGPAHSLHEAFSRRPGFRIRPAGPMERHRQYEVERRAP